MNDLRKVLTEMDNAATPGRWCQFGTHSGPFQAEARAAFDRRELHKIDTSHHMSAVTDGEPKRIAEWRHADDAAFAEALINAWRDGKLEVQNDG